MLVIFAMALLLSMALLKSCGCFYAVLDSFDVASALVLYVRPILH
jgi:hypothetical protein